jgi:hypothetical protein
MMTLQRTTTGSVRSWTHRSYTGRSRFFPVFLSVPNGRVAALVVAGRTKPGLIERTLGTHD